jgi:hypothetical protein
MVLALMALLGLLTPFVVLLERNRGLKDAHACEPPTRIAQLRRLPVTPIHQLRPGVVARVAGRIRRAGPLLTAPISGRPCLGHHVRAKHVEASFIGSVTMAEATLFWIEDDSGRALVDAAELAEGAFGGDASEGSYALHVGNREADARLEAVASRRGVTLSSEFGFPNSMSYREAILTEGARVSVAGFVVVEPHPQGEALESGVPMRLVLRGSAEGPVLITDESAANG